MTSAPADIMLELLSLAGLILCCAIPLVSVNRSPDIIPAHFNLRGEADGYASNRSILYPLPVVIVLYIGMSILTRYPRIYNYAVEITAKNAQIQYRLAMRFMRVLKLEVLLTFTFLEYLIVVSAFGHHQALTALSFGPVVLVMILGSVGYYINRSFKAK